MASDGSVQRLRTAAVLGQHIFGILLLQIPNIPNICVSVIKSELPQTIIYYTHTHLGEAGGWREIKTCCRLPEESSGDTSAFKISFCLLAVRVGLVPHLSNHFSWNNSQPLRVFLPINCLVSGLCHHREIFCGPIWNANDLKQGFS